jgi:hypothetical protein
MFFNIIAVRADDFYPAANLGYVRGVFADYGCIMTNAAPDLTGANMEYVLKTVDMCNDGTTEYGAGAYATAAWANNAAVDYSAENLIIKDPYLIFTGPQYIDTGINPAGVLKVKIEYSHTEYVSQFPNPWGARTTGYNGVELQYVNGSNVHFQIMDATGNLTIALAMSVDSKRHTAVYDYGDCYFDGVFKGKTTNYSGIISPYNIFIGALNENGARNSATGFNGKVYSMQIWKSGTLVRDFVPHYDSVAGQWGMQDKVSGNFFGNAGTGTLTGWSPAE